MTKEEYDKKREEDHANNMNTVMKWTEKGNVKKLKECMSFFYRTDPWIGIYVNAMIEIDKKDQFFINALLYRKKRHGFIRKIIRDFREFKKYYKNKSGINFTRIGRYMAFILGWYNKPIVGRIK